MLIALTAATGIRHDGGVEERSAVIHMRTTATQTAKRNSARAPSPASPSCRILKDGGPSSCD